jgi:hypothetical protein
MFLLIIAAVAIAAGPIAYADARADTTPCSHLSASDAAKATGVPFVTAEISGQIKTEYDPINSCAYAAEGNFGIKVLVGIKYQDGDMARA